jgi:carboxyl-terminal processing protease
MNYDPLKVKKALEPSEGDTMKAPNKKVHILAPLWVTLSLAALMLVLGASGGFVAGNAMQPATNCPESPEVCEQFGVFWESWDYVNRHFVDAEAIDPQHMTEGAIQGMLNSLGDQGHTRFLSAEEAERWAESLEAEFEGIGAYVDVRNGQALIVAPIEGAPAEEAGLLPGDIILEVDGEDTTGWTVEELVTNVRGPKGSEVNLLVLHEGDDTPVEITVRRDRVEVPSVNWAMLPDDIALVRLNSFAQRSSEELQQALTDAQQEGAQALIFDLRSNPGGLVNEAIGVASQFLPEGTTVLVEEDRDGDRTTSEAWGDGAALDIPMVVLIDSNTASSAEIVSGALQDAGRADLVGVTTVGTGTVLTTFPLEGGARLLLGTSQWLTPDGRLIRKQGIEPDIEVILPTDAMLVSPTDAENLSPDELAESDDAQLLRAIEVLQDTEHDTTGQE